MGIYIHNLKDKSGNTTNKGKNPSELFGFQDGRKFLDVIKCYDPNKMHIMIFKIIFRIG